MKKKSYQLFLLIICFNSISAQVPINTVVEHFTNTKCSICANRNPGLNSNLDLHPDVIRLSIHPSSPYAACLLSQQNTVDNDARTNYYGVYGGTPRIVINGNVIAGSVSYADTSIFSPFIGLSSFAIEVSQIKYQSDSIKAIVKIKRVDNNNSSLTASLFVGLVEDTVFYTGSNGEPLHFNVLRKSVFSPQGILVNLPLNVGDSTIIEGTKTTQNFWNIARMKTVAILQNTTSKSLIQSGISTTSSQGTTTSIIENIKDFDISLSPNPAIDFISVKAASNEEYSYKIYNVIGNVIDEGFFKSNMQYKTIDLPAGVYFFAAAFKGQFTSKRFIVKH